MCLICVEFDKNRMSFGEARRALGEMREKVGATHVAEVEAKLAAAEEARDADAANTPPDP